MAVYYVDAVDGSDSNSGTSASSAFLTIGKADGTAGSGDTVKIAPGLYGELIRPPLSLASELVYSGDVFGLEAWPTRRSGRVYVTQWRSGSSSAPTNSDTVEMAGADYITFENITFHGWLQNCLDTWNSLSTNITIRNCTFDMSSSVGKGIRLRGGTSPGTQTWLIENCLFIGGYSSSDGIQIYVESAAADYSADVTIRNCVFDSARIYFLNGALSTGKVYGYLIENCTFFRNGTIYANSTNLRSSSPAIEVYGCVFKSYGSTAFYAATSGQISEDYNVVTSSTGSHTNTAVGANTVEDYELFHHYCNDWINGVIPAPHLTPLLTHNSHIATLDGHASPPATDMFGVARPPAATKGMPGAIMGWTAEKETTTTQTGQGTKISGWGAHEFLVPVVDSATTLKVYARYDSSYSVASGGSKPTLRVLDHGAGITDTADTMTSAANTWEQLSVTFTPSSKGFVRVRFEGYTDAQTGTSFFDDWSVA